MLKDKWQTFDKFQKVMLCLLAAMVILFAILMGMSRCRLGVEFHESLLEMQGTAENAAYSGKAQGADVSIVVSRSDETTVGLSFEIGEHVHDTCLVEYPLEPIQTEHGQKPGLRVSRNGEVVFEGAYDPADYSEGIGYVLYDQDGQFTFSHALSVHVYGGGNDYWEHYEPGVDTILRFANGPELTARGDWLGFFVACFAVLMAAILTVFPYELFLMKHHWYVENPEPTDFYYLSIRVSSVLLAGMALIAFLFALRTIS